MRMIRPIGIAALMCGCGVIGFFAALHMIPFHASDTIWRTMERTGVTRNVLGQPGYPVAKKDVVPLANPDMISRRVIYDLANGPVLFEADVPTDLQYWSVTVFGHNSDTLFVANDRATGPGPFRLIIRTADQRSREPANAYVVSPSRLGFVLVRAVMKDRNDPADVARTKAAVADERFTMLANEPRQ
ncbi:DUF1254 domain-containing protein [Hephaestia sp. GCM10023244]|uniref:DUF1254 domain-containing protein n=1 Tax=unclassified Hephaestia TaxID=2631281 RepID=UPI0020774C56|nr:DUF1254 domain-containing protein [Hephaestia sp. MAHUQ-44]MCM8732481.1 DUF1254 domain-containing protein [Hephaestia sp. MAHUQ-44]